MTALNSNMKTYLKANVSQKQKEHFRAHMHHLGFESTITPDVFEATTSPLGTIMVKAVKDILDRSNQIPMHSHTFMEIFQYISDTKVEYLIGTHRYILKQGDIVCVPPGICHQVLHYEPDDVPCVRHHICIHPNFLDTFGWAMNSEQYYIIRTEDRLQTYLGMLCQMSVRECERMELHWRNTVNGYAQILLAQILRNANSSITAEAAGVFENLLAFVDNNLSQRITLIDTAQHFFISDRTVNREFQKNLGISFYRYVTQRRLLMAQNLIFNDVPMNEVCQRCGFADYPTFYRAFKKEYGVSPRQMKQMDTM